MFHELYTFIHYYLDSPVKTQVDSDSDDELITVRRRGKRPSLPISGTSDDDDDDDDDEGGDDGDDGLTEGIFLCIYLLKSVVFYFN